MNELIRKTLRGTIDGITLIVIKSIINFHTFLSNLKIWNNTSLIKNPYVVVTNPKLWDRLIKD